MTPIEVATGCPERPVRGPLRFADDPAQRLIDDFERQGNMLPRNDGRNGGWVLGHDGSFEQLEADTSNQCAARGRRAGHFFGRGFSNWGANWTALLRDQPQGEAVAYDASAYRGISFWAAASPNMVVPFVLPVGITTLDIAWNGPCPGCMKDYYRTTVSLDHAWRRFEIRFSELAQNDDGESPVELRLEAMVGFILWPDRDFDLWIDDVRFEP